MSSPNKFDALKSEVLDEEEDEVVTSRSTGPVSGEEPVDLEEEWQLPPLELPANHHRLQHVYCLWFSSSAKNSTFGHDLRLVGRFGSVEQFWSVYSHCARVSDMAGSHCDYHLFRESIRPMWEDAANRQGGKWSIRLRKGLAARMWENLLLALLGGQFGSMSDEVCGVVVSVRHQEDFIAVWNRTATDANVKTRIRDTMRRVLNLPPNTIVDYKMHVDSIRKKSNYRNAGLFVK